MIGTPYRGRLAPSPTGLLHLGHARTFLIAAERAGGGTLILRNDDLDTQRSRPEFAQAMLEDLAWLGIRWTEGPQPDGTEPGNFGPYAQSLRGSLYTAAFQQLSEAGFLYPCICSRKDLLSAPHAPHAEDEDEPLYPGTCRERNPESDEPSAWRFRVTDGEEVSFYDALLGPQTFIAGRDFGDFVVMRRDGVPSYQLACVADDAVMQITEVVRGRDLLRSTARQILLLRALGHSIPAYAHVELMRNERGERLAKRDAARSLRYLRESGLTPQEVRKMAIEEIE
ncbi:tRNA glutamyl-Q(34) synthetase GluQRS [Terriglobus roseus]|uniref:Glutamyl-tRNA synthetase n=1 Tax=Terriglobus roseus TaxID=392734 RepID=A0A1G7MIV9_9BACT|nr:tRNA glutamyl-Q(34) synthetase GluQRS [Terriglobus roseus]SDF61653.1 glutamyl-tRNA synthetase [Terriglobus roseus]